MVLRLGPFWIFDLKIATPISQFHQKTPVVSLYEDIMNSFGDICIKPSPQSFYINRPPYTRPYQVIFGKERIDLVWPKVARLNRLHCTALDFS